MVQVHRIQVFYVEAGGGHRSAATALKEVSERQNRPWRIDLVNLNHIFRPTDLMKTLTGYGTEELYNLMLKHGWTAIAPLLLPPMHGLIWALRGKQVSLLEQYWSANPADLVVSVIPHFNRTMHIALNRTLPSAAFATILTDFADIPPRVWFERQPQYVVCGTDRAVAQAREFGLTPDEIFRVSGMILRPSFYGVPPVDRAAARRSLGLDPDRATALVLFGGEGSRAMLEIARRLGESGLDLQLILMYGRNEHLGGRLRELRLKMPVHVQGFTPDVPRLMQVSDFLIGKPGPGSISEALAMKLPVIVDRNVHTMPQERYNAEWLVEKGLGKVVRSWAQIVPAVSELLTPGTLSQYRARAAAVDNRAVFEITDLFEEFLRRGPARRTPAATR